MEVNTPELTPTGDERSKFDPSPNCPPPFSPQQLTWPFADRPHVNADPAAMLTRRIAPFPASTGTAVGVIDGSPSWPRAFSPQHQGAPYSSTAHVWLSPAAIAQNTWASGTRLGATFEPNERTPDCPRSLLPQHHAAPSRAIAHV